MAWDAGTVTVDSSGNVTGSGQALALYNAISNEEQADNPLPNPAVMPPGWDGTLASWVSVSTDIMVKIKRSWARQARAIASIATYVKQNAAINVTIPAGSGGAGLQTLPSSLTAGQPTAGPSAQKTLSGSIA